MQRLKMKFLKSSHTVVRCQECFQGTPQRNRLINTLKTHFIKDKTRQDKTRQDKTRQDKTRHDKTRQDKIRQNKTRHDKITHNKTVATT
jgi:hypothetical protein